MSVVANSFRKEATLLEFESNTCVAKERKYVANIFDMFFRRAQKYYNVGEEDERKLPYDS